MSFNFCNEQKPTVITASHSLCFARHRETLSPSPGSDTYRTTLQTLLEKACLQVSHTSVTWH